MQGFQQAASYCDMLKHGKKAATPVKATKPNTSNYNNLHVLASPKAT